MSIDRVNIALKELYVPFAVELAVVEHVEVLRDGFLCRYILALERWPAYEFKGKSPNLL